MTEFISIRGARENNLKDVTLEIPKRKLTIFTGVSGSGKSSIVFDTLATEAQRQLYENFRAGRAPSAAASGKRLASSPTIFST
jgi:excinuclease UvrABC ATPase subunit